MTLVTSITTSKAASPTCLPRNGRWPRTVTVLALVRLTQTVLFWSSARSQLMNTQTKLFDQRAFLRQMHLVANRVMGKHAVDPFGDANPCDMRFDPLDSRLDSRREVWVGLCRGELHRGRCRRFFGCFFRFFDRFGRGFFGRTRTGRGSDWRNCHERAGKHRDEQQGGQGSVFHLTPIARAGFWSPLTARVHINHQDDRRMARLYGRLSSVLPSPPRQAWALAWAPRRAVGIARDRAGAPGLRARARD